MTQAEFNRVRLAMSRLFAPRFDGRVSDWCGENVVFNEPKIQGPMSFVGREYLRVPLDCWSDQDVADEVLCWGTRCGKTMVVRGGMQWRIVWEPMRAIWVMPNTHGTGGARNMSRTRWRKQLLASPCTAGLIPTGASRHDFSTLQQIINGSIIDFAGSNSEANLAGNPCDVVVQDEVDKFKATSVKEADASYLADQRAKEFSNPKRFKSSTPTVKEGLIWQALLKTDIRRRFLPCPHCRKHVVLAWSKDYSVLDPVPEKLGGEAWMAWDKAAKRKDGTWDLDRVASSAHYECPFCHGRIMDGHKMAMDRAGVWKPTREAPPGSVGFHLPSMYASSTETSAGRMAVRFLESKRSAQGLRGFINSDLAEPYQYQDRLMAVRVVVNSGLKKTRDGIADRTVRLAAGDRQRGVKEKGELPHWWHVIADVKVDEASGRVRIQIVSEGKEATEANLVARFEEYKVEPSCVVLDSGWDTDNVYSLCMDRGYYCLKSEGDAWFSGHRDKGQKIYSPPKPLHTMLMAHAPKYDYVRWQGELVPDSREPMFMLVAKFPLMELFAWIRSVAKVSFEVPEDVSDDFKEHLAAWGVEEFKKKSTNEIVKQWKQYRDRDDLYQCCCYICLLMLDAGLIDMGPIGGEQK